MTLNIQIKEAAPGHIEIRSNRTEDSTPTHLEKAFAGVFAEGFVAILDLLKESQPYPPEIEKVRAVMGEVVHKATRQPFPPKMVEPEPGGPERSN